MYITIRISYKKIGAGGGLVGQRVILGILFGFFFLVKKSCSLTRKVTAAFV